MTYFDSNGDPVEVCQPEVYDEPTSQDLDATAMTALLSVVFELGTWAGKDKVRQYAARVVMRQEAQSAKNFARENKVSESLVFLRLSEAKRFIGLERSKAGKKGLYNTIRKKPLEL